MTGSPTGPPVREELRGLEPYGAPQLEVEFRLNTNENPYPAPDRLVELVATELRRAAPDLNRYPDRDALRLRAELARYLSDTAGHQVGPDQLWAANGSNEVLQQLLQAFGGPGRTAMTFEPSYSMHPIIARSTGTAWVRVARSEPGFELDLDTAVAAIAEHRPHVLFLCSPNNPTATALTPEAVATVYAAAQAARDCLVVLDEAYAEFSHHPSLLPLLAGRPNLVVTRTMSKAFGAAGVRLGYLAAAAAVVRALLLVRLPYHLSTVTQVTALAALACRDELLRNVEAIKVERDRLATEIAGLGLDVVASDANFLLFGDGRLDQAALWQALLERGVLVRDVGLPGWLRVTAGTPAETAGFLDALRGAVKDLVTEDRS